MKYGPMAVGALVLGATVALLVGERKEPENQQLYTVTIPALGWKQTNCFEARLHTNDCYVIRWVETNEFHAWMVPVVIEKQKGRQ